jgi:cell division protein FtsI/penicillin-binding protein 2
MRLEGETDDQLVKRLAEALTPLLFEERVRYRDYLSTQEKEEARKEIAKNIEFQLRLEGVVWVPLAKKIDEQTKERIAALKIDGIGFEEESKRFYPEGSLGSHLLGFVGKESNGDDKGYFGLEGFYNEKLSGFSGRLVQEIDALGRPILIADKSGLEALDGVSLVTTIDRTVQFITERKLIEGVKKYGAKAGAVVVLDTKTGGVLGIASYPGFDPRDPLGFKQENHKNLAVSEVYEPGSTFKIITAAAGLDSGAIDNATICPCSGPIVLDKYEITTWNKKYNPNSNVTQILQKSDNIGAAFIGEKVGSNRFLDYIQDFGFGQLTGVDLEGEELGILKGEGEWNQIDLVTASFGQGLSVTPLQMTNAVAAIANDGKLMKPFLVQKVVGSKAELEFKPKEIRQVIKSTTAASMKQLLLSSVEADGKKKTILYGYRIGGKTGTAQVPIAGHYSSKTVASFVGFGPVEDPRFAMIVVLFEPSSSIYAAETAEPLFFQMVKELYPYWGIEVKR